MTDMNKLLRAQFRGEPQDESWDEEKEDERESIGGKSDGGAGGDREHGLGETNMNTLIREAMFGR